jgi:NtrC-family two-component system sensor histidine kinase KinB
MDLAMLKEKILVGYGIAFAFMTAVVVWAIINLVFLGDSASIIYSENYRSILAAENMIDAVERQDSGMLLMFLDETHKGITGFRKNEAEFLKWLARAKDNVSIKGEEKLVRKIETDYNSYRQQFSSLTDFPNTNRKTLIASFQTYLQTINPLFIKLRQNCTQLRLINEKIMYNAGKRADLVSKRAVWVTASVTIITMIFALIFSLRLIERIVTPIRTFTEAARKIAAMDFKVHLPVKHKDELGDLASEFTQMMTILDQTLKNNLQQLTSERNKGEAILTCVEDGLIIVDTHLKVTNVNPAAKRMLDLKMVETTHFKCSDILKDSSICKLISQIIESGEHPNIPDEQRMVTLSKGEQFRHYLFSIAIIYGKESELNGIVLLLRDVTRSKEVERLKNEFILAASHELRIPLTSLGMSIDGLKEHMIEHLGDQEKELFNAAQEEVHRMKALVADLLDLSKIEPGRIAIEYDSVSINTLFEHVQKIFKSQLDRKGVTLTGNLNSDLPNIRADANKITWVLSNLISNALRYVDDGGHILFMANLIGPQVHLSVQDNGPGIPLNYQSKIFQKYVQVKGQESSGAGLGLAICKEIVRAHGGGIWVESMPGKGSTFTFTLPVAS